MISTYKRAGAFIHQNARPLDLARWKYHFENGSWEDVLTALSYYQNEDGGFGSPLDPNSLNPESTPLQVFYASEIIKEISFKDKNHPVILGMLKYLESGKYFNGRVWSYTAESNNEYPCAHWLYYRKGDVRNAGYCPTAALAGFIVNFADKNSALYRLGRRLVREAYISLESAATAYNHMYIKSCASLFEWLIISDSIDIVNMSAFASKLKALVRDSVDKETDEWDAENALLPSFFITNKDSMFYPDLEELANYECSYIKEHQMPSGGYDIRQVWMSNPDEWAVSRFILMADQTIKNMLYLKGFNMIDEFPEKERVIIESVINSSSDDDDAEYSDEDDYLNEDSEFED